MKHTTKFVGLDVAKATIAVAVADAGGGPARYWGQVANTPEAMRKLVAHLGGPERLLVCYEAGPTGYGLQRQLEEMGVACCVVAPSLTPVRPGDRVKTDRRDALRLAMLLRAGELTPVWVPDAAHEALRELVRAREEAVEDQRWARQRLGSFLLRHGVQPPKKMTRWKAMYMRWLEALPFETSALHTAYQEYLRAVQEATARVERLEMAIRDEVRRGPLEPVVRALQALRGVAELTAATAAVEIADFTRFLKASSLMSYTGLTPSESSSGATQRRGGISKTGNAHLRRVLVEAAWSYRYKPGVKGARKKRQAGLDPEVVAMAHKAEERLHRRYWRLVQRGKCPAVAVTAVARELIRFMWAIGCHVQARKVAERAMMVEFESPVRNLWMRGRWATGTGRGGSSLPCYVPGHQVLMHVSSSRLLHDGSIKWGTQPADMRLLTVDSPGPSYTPSAKKANRGLAGLVHMSSGETKMCYLMI